MKNKIYLCLLIFAVSTIIPSAYTQINPNLRNSKNNYSSKINTNKLDKNKIRSSPRGSSSRTPHRPLGDRGSREIIRQSSMPEENFNGILSSMTFIIDNYDWMIIEERTTRPRALSRYNTCTNQSTFNFPICHPSGNNGVYFLKNAHFRAVGPPEYENSFNAWARSGVATFKLRFQLESPADLQGFSENFRDLVVRDLVLESATLEFTFTIGQPGFERYDPSEPSVRPFELKDVEVLELSLGGHNRAKSAITRILRDDFTEMDRSAFARELECMTSFRNFIPYELDFSKDHLSIRDGQVYFDRIRR